MKTSGAKSKDRADSLFPEAFDFAAWTTKRSAAKNSGKHPSPFSSLFVFFERVGRLLRRLPPVRKLQSLWFARPGQLRQFVGKPSLFRNLDVTEALSALKTNSYYAGLMIPEPELAEIQRYIDTTRVRGGFGARDLGQLEFFPERIKEVESLIGRSLNVAHYADPTVHCAAIDRISTDPKLMEVATRKLGAVPKEKAVFMWWSFVTEMSNEDRKRETQTVDFHFDELDANFLYVSFYLSEVTVGCGEHVLVRGTHSGKPLRFLFGKAVQSEQTLVSLYGKERIVEVVGKRGSGFIEDTNCFHKAAIPRTKARLILQIRYHLQRHGGYKREGYGG